jgi:hypothetical protein
MDSKAGKEREAAARHSQLEEEEMAERTVIAEPHHDSSFNDHAATILNQINEDFKPFKKLLLILSTRKDFRMVIVRNR